MKKSTNPDDYQDVPRPVAVMAKDIPDKYATGRHSHKRAQLVYASSGVMTVKTQHGTWVIPPQRAVWVPCGIEYETQSAGPLAMRTVYVASDAAHGLPSQCCVVSISPLLRELILRAASLPIAYDPHGPDGRIMQLILDEIKATEALPLHLPTPSHPRLAEICTALLRNPRRDETIEDWAHRAGTSSRTIARLFRRQTGMTFSGWRQQARLLQAMTRLAAGQSAKRVALELGYSSPSAFTSMFKRAFGTTPSRYFAKAD